MTKLLARIKRLAVAPHATLMLCCTSWLYYHNGNNIETGEGGKTVWEIMISLQYRSWTQLCSVVPTLFVNDCRFYIYTNFTYQNWKEWFELYLYSSSTQHNNQTDKYRNNFQFRLHKRLLNQCHIHGCRQNIHLKDTSVCKITIVSFEQLWSI